MFDQAAVSIFRDSPAFVGGQKLGDVRVTDTTGPLGVTLILAARVGAKRARFGV